MEIFLFKKNLIENCQKNYKQTCSKQKIANISSVNECHKIDTSSRVRKPEHMRSRLNVPGRSWRPNREIAWHIERLLLHVRNTNRKRSQFQDRQRTRISFNGNRILEIFTRLNSEILRCFDTVFPRPYGYFSIALKVIYPCPIVRMLLNIIFRCLEILAYFHSCDPENQASMFSHHLSK